MIGIGCLIARQMRSGRRVGLRWPRLTPGSMHVKATVPAQRRLIVGISGASGVIYGLRVLQLLRNSGVENHLVMSKTAELTFAYETTVKIAEVKAAAHTTHSIDDMAASIAS